ncbi:MAG: aldo/keto reductase [Clostridiales bacterium]|nr:aldo/keto reductase [Clostridiales bacterium]
MNEFTLSDGSRIPQIGFGTYQIQSPEPVLRAIEAGYRFFDTASLYETERTLGKALRESGLPREEFIIETKLWIDEMDNPAGALGRSLKRLDTDYADIFMIHWPRETGEADENWKERDLETYRGMEKLVEAGKVRRLGLSNFLPHHLKNILDNCSIRPVVNQLEVHPGYTQEAALRFCRDNGVQVMAWSPFGRGQSPDILGNRMVAYLAEKYGKSTRQITLRYLIEKGIMPIPKATSEEHIRANLDVFDFNLTEDEVSMLTGMPQTTWLGEHPDFAIPTARSSAENRTDS